MHTINYTGKLSRVAGRYDIFIIFISKKVKCTIPSLKSLSAAARWSGVRFLRSSTSVLAPSSNNIWTIADLDPVQNIEDQDTEFNKIHK